MIESNLFTVAPGGFLRRRFRLALTVWRATDFCARPHEVLFTGDATAPQQSAEQQQGQKRTG